MQNAAPKRTRHVSVRFTQDEYVKLQERAHAAAIEVSALIRKAALDVEIPRRAKQRSPDIAALGRAIVALNRVGSNINQLARVAHQTGDALSYRVAEEDRVALAEAARAVMAALRAE